MKNYFFLFGLFFITGFLKAQINNPNNVPMSVDCWTLSQSSFNLNTNIFKHYSCFELPSNNTTVSINGNRQVELTAGKEIHLKPGFSVSNLSGTGNFHALIDKEEVGVAVFAPLSSLGEVSKCEKLELGINLPNEITNQIDNYFNNIPHNELNPFAYEDISIEARFSFFNNGDDNLLYNFDLGNLPSGSLLNYESRIINAFYYKEYHTEFNSTNPDGIWIEDTTSFNFRIRFAPNKVGLWRVDIVVKIDNQIYSSLMPIYFKCTPSDCPGFIEGGETSNDNRHFVFENGDVFFGIGQNIPVPLMDNPQMPSGYSSYREFPPKAYELQRSYMQDLSDNNGNLVRIMHGEWCDAIEWEKLGDYEKALPFAWEFDRTIDLCANVNLYILWLQNSHTAFMAHNPYGNDLLAWPNNPYNTELGLNSIESFFTDPDALKFYQRRIRYMMSRWGYSPQIAGIQTMSEIDAWAEDRSIDYRPYADPSTIQIRTDINNWFCDLKDYIQQTIGYNFNIGTAFTSDIFPYVDDNSAMECADFNDYHPYATNRNRNLNRHSDFNNKLFYDSEYWKPMIMGEIGVFDQNNKLFECNENEFHNDLWSSAMMGGWATGLHWHNWSDDWNMNLRYNFNYVREFFDSYIDFKNIEWEPRKWPENLENGNGIITDYDKRRDDYFEAIYMTGDADFIRDKRAFGWVHNRSSYWYNKLSTCENNIINAQNSNSNNGDDITQPSDDDSNNSVLLQNGNSGKKNRKIRITNMSNYQRFDLTWYDPYNGALMATSEENHGVGDLVVNVPDAINWTQFHDLVFLMSPNNTSFYSPGLNSIPTEIFIISNQSDEIKSDSNSINNEFGLEIYVFPNPTNEFVKIQCEEKILYIEICNILGDKISDMIIDANYAEIDMTVLPKGIYILKIVSENKTFINRVIFQ